MAELELSKDADEICKNFLINCNSKCNSLTLSDSDKSEALLELSSVINDSNEIFSNETKDLLRQMFSDRIAGNNDLRRSFSEELGVWKNLLSSRRERLSERLTLERDLVNKSDVNSQLQSIHNELIEKIEEVRSHTNQLIDKETSTNLEIKERLSSTLVEVRERLSSSLVEIAQGRSEINDLEDKYKALVSHREAQKNHYSQQLQSKSLHAQLLTAKLAQQKEKQSQQSMGMKAVNDQVIRLRQSISDMERQLAMCESKCDEFQGSVNGTSDMLDKYSEQEKVLLEYVAKMSSENSQLESQLSDLEGQIVLGSSRLQRSEETAQQMRLQAKHKENICRALQSKRSAVIKESIQSTSIDNETTSSSSSSSSSSSRYPRDNSTNTGDETSATQSNQIA
eukprot:gene19758-25690_t